MFLSSSQSINLTLATGATRFGSTTQNAVRGSSSKRACRSVSARLDNLSQILPYIDRVNLQIDVASCTGPRSRDFQLSGSAAQEMTATAGTSASTTLTPLA